MVMKWNIPLNANSQPKKKGGGEGGSVRHEEKNKIHAVDMH